MDWAPEVVVRPVSDVDASMASYRDPLGRLGPAMAQLGIQVDPRITFHAAHEVFAPQAVRITAT